MWWLQQHGGQQQRGLLFGVLVVVCVVAAVLVRAIGEGSEVAQEGTQEGCRGGGGAPSCWGQAPPQAGGQIEGISLRIRITSRIQNVSGMYRMYPGTWPFALLVSRMYRDVSVSGYVS